MIFALDLQPAEVRIARVDGLGVADLRTVAAPNSAAEVVDAVRVLAARQPGRPTRLAMSVGARVDWPQQIAQGLDLPYAVAPRGACLALGEQRLGAARGLSDLVYLRWGDELEGGLLLDGKPWLRPLDVGHLSLDPRGPRCGCGARGCLAAYVALGALDQMALAVGMPRNQPSAGLGSGLHAELAWRADAGEPSAVALVHAAAGKLGLAASLLARTFAVRDVVVQLQPPPRLHPAVLAELRQVLLRQAGPDHRVHAATLGADAALVGATALFD